MGVGFEGEKGDKGAQGEAGPPGPSATPGKLTEQATVIKGEPGPKGDIVSSEIYDSHS